MAFTETARSLTSVRPARLIFGSESILAHLGEPLEPPPVCPARGPPADWDEFVQGHDDRDVFQASPDELPVINIHSL